MKISELIHISEIDMGEIRVNINNINVLVLDFFNQSNYL